MKFQNHILTAQPASFELKSDTSGRISGYGSIFGNADRQGDIVLPGAFTKSLARTQASGEMPVMLWSHAQEQPIGRWTAVREDSKGLYVEGFLNLKTERGREAHQHIVAGDAGGLSIGYTTPKGGREYVSKGQFHLKEVDLFEISVVAIPANPQARISSVKRMASKAEAVDMLRGCGMSRKAAQRFAAGGWPALSNEIDPDRAMKLVQNIDRIIEQLRN